MSESRNKPNVPASSRRRWGAYLVAVAVVIAFIGAGVAALLSHIRAHERVPSEAQISAAASVVASGFRDGDVIRVDPYWFTAPRLPLSRGLSEQGHEQRFPYEAFDLSGHPDALNLLRYRRLWIVAAYSALSQDDAERTGLPLVPVQRWDDLGAIRVALYELPPSRLGYDLLRSFGDAVVHRGERRCTWDTKAHRHRCHEQPWKDVRLALKEVGDATRLCILAEPHPAHTVLSIMWPHVPLDGTLVFHSGFSIEGARRTDGADTTVRLLVDDEVVAEWVEPKNDFVWRTTRVPPVGGVHRVSVEIVTPKAGWRQLCIDGAVVKAEGESLLSR